LTLLRTLSIFKGRSALATDSAKTNIVDIVTPNPVDPGQSQRRMGAL
jgi:hypothetical protein